MSFQEKDIYEIANYLFNRKPQGPCSIQLNFDTNLKNCYQTLLTLFTEGMKKLYGDEAQDYFDTAVRWIIILLVVVFDPLAICLLLAGNAGLMHRKKDISYLTEEDVMKEVEIAPIIEERIQEISVNRDGHGTDGS